MLIYPAIFTPAKEGGFVITFPDVPEAITQAENKAEGFRNALDCLETALSIYVDQHRPLPHPSNLRGKVAVPVSPMSAMKLMIYQGMMEKGITKAVLARRLAVHPPQVERLLDLLHASKPDQIEKALAALGLALVADVRKAA